MPPGDRSIVTDQSGPTSSRLGRCAWLAFPDLGPASLASAGFAPGCHRTTHDPVRTSCPFTPRHYWPAPRRRHPRPPGLAEAIGRAGHCGQTLDEATPARPFPPRALSRMRRTDEVSLNRAPLMRFASPSALTGRGRVVRGRDPPINRWDPASLRTIPLRRFRPASARASADRSPSFVPAVFRRAESPRWCSAVADACGRSFPAESVACVLRALSRSRPRQRLDDLLLTSRSSSIACAGWDRCSRVPHAHERPDHVKRRRCDSAARAGSFADAFLGAAFQTRITRTLAA